MTRTITFVLLTVMVVLGTAQVVFAQSFEDADAAYLRQDYAIERREWRPLAEQGDAVAQFNLGLMYYNGQGVAQDYQEAVRWYRLAAEQGDAVAQNNLGVMYYNGQGVAQDYQEAVRWYRLAAEQGNAAAQTNLGVMYDNDQGVAQDYVRAHMWFNLAGVSGNPAAAPNRGNVAARMTPAQIAEAQAMARNCQASNFRDCD